MNIKDLRKSTGLTQTQFGNQYRIPLRTLQHWENGTRKPAEYIVYLLESVVSSDYGFFPIEIKGDKENTYDSNLHVKIGRQTMELDISGWRYFSVEENVEAAAEQIASEIEVTDQEMVILKAKLKDFYES